MNAPLFVRSAGRTPILWNKCHGVCAVALTEFVFGTLQSRTVPASRSITSQQEGREERHPVVQEERRGADPGLDGADGADAACAGYESLGCA